MNLAKLLCLAGSLNLIDRTTVILEIFNEGVIHNQGPREGWAEGANAPPPTFWCHTKKNELKKHK